jgi:hypothetical protein
MALKMRCDTSWTYEMHKGKPHLKLNGSVLVPNPDEWEVEIWHSESGMPVLELVLQKRQMHVCAQCK